MNKNYDPKMKSYFINQMINEVKNKDKKNIFRRC